ncbi:MATE family efflux transporter [Anaerocolumna aminovalerica]|uniref:MATE family efflux transporter n=1 Tax=Anaerocolumna aminovalerica TaxID=1527 RepID=UPI000BE25467|nr:MATE family efflux transporter [Anaerocolumna aminovalerica]
MDILYRIKNISQDKTFLRKIVAITIPIAIQNFLNTTLNFIDTLMIGTLGETTIAAVGLANKVFFVFSLLLFGICSGSGVLTAQYWGKREGENIRKVLGISLILAILASLIFTIPGIIIPNGVMTILTNSDEAIRIGAVYLAIVAISYPFTAITNAYVTLLRGVNQVLIPVVISTIAILTNVVLNYILIFGKFGFPELGVAGAAIATLIARIVETSSLLIIVYIKKGPAAAKISEMLNFNRNFLGKFFHTVSPVIINEFMWGLGVTMYALVYGRMGDASMAAVTVSQTVEQIMQVIFISISGATAVILGNELGANKLEDADNHAKNFIFIQITLSILVGILFFFIRDPIISLFYVSDEVAGYIRLCFLVYILYMPFKMFNTMNVVGILRSGGDTKAALFIDVSGVWFIGIPMAVIGGLLLHLPIFVVYALVFMEEIYKSILGIIRYRKKKWLRNIISTDSLL